MDLLMPDNLINGSVSYNSINEYRLFLVMVTQVGRGCDPSVELSVDMSPYVFIKDTAEIVRACEGLLQRDATVCILDDSDGRMKADGPPLLSLCGYDGRILRFRFHPRLMQVFRECIWVSVSDAGLVPSLCSVRIYELLSHYWQIGCDRRVVGIGDLQFHLDVFPRSYDGRLFRNWMLYEAGLLLGMVGVAQVELMMYTNLSFRYRPVVNDAGDIVQVEFLVSSHRSGTGLLRHPS